MSPLCRLEFGDGSLEFWKKELYTPILAHHMPQQQKNFRGKWEIILTYFRNYFTKLNPPEVMAKFQDTNNIMLCLHKLRSLYLRTLKRDNRSVFTFMHELC